MSLNKAVGLVIIFFAGIAAWQYGGTTSQYLFPNDNIISNCFAPPLEITATITALALVGMFIGYLTYKSSIKVYTAFIVILAIVAIGILIELVGN